MATAFIIWTMQRSGGTTLAHLLIRLAGLPTLGHEPFNFDRRLGDLHKDFLQSQDEAALRAGIKAALARPVTMKHCYELVP